MLLVINGYERDKYKKIMQQLHRLRYEHFIVRRQWSLPSRDGLEKDQYDNDLAVYFISINTDGLIEMTVRLTPTVQSSLLADYFPQLIETGEAARDGALYEGTRYIINPAAKSAEAIRRAKAQTLAALVEWCLDRDIQAFQAVIDKKALASFVEISIRTRPLGLSHEFGGGKDVVGGGECVAFRWDICRELLSDIENYGHLQRAQPRYIEAAMTTH